MGWMDVIDFATDFIPGGDIIDAAIGVGDVVMDHIRTQPTARPTHPAETGYGPLAPLPMPELPADARAFRNSAAHQAAVGCAITLPMGVRQVAQCAPGYVAVDRDRDGIKETCMLKEVARACGLWKPRPKPVLTASDRKALNRATRVMGKVDTVVSQTNDLRGKPKLVKKSSRK